LRSIDPTLLAIFETEQREILERIRMLLEPLASAAPPPAAVEEALRRTHTLKGAARAVGLAGTELIAHRLETLFLQIRDGRTRLEGPVLAALERGFDAVEDILGSALAGRPEPDAGAALAEIEAATGAGPRRAPVAPAGGPPPAVAEASADTVRVSARRIDQLVRSSSQLLAATGQYGSAGGLDELSGRVAGLAAECARLRQLASAVLRQQHANPAFTPIFEGLDSLAAQLAAMTTRLRAAELAAQRRAWGLEQLASDLHQDACAVRMTPADSVFGAFRKMVRDLARDAGREIDFRFEGAEVEADRLVLQRLKDPVMHLLRNAVTHGIEPPRERLAAGKPAAGEVTLRLEAQGDRLRVTVRDDGHGIDLARVAETAVKLGLTDAAGAASAGPAEIARLLLEPGLSTAENVNELAGRGIGLAVVQQEVARLHGEISIDGGAPGAGTAIVITAPLTISTHHVVLVGCGRHTFAIPGASVERLSRVSPGEMREAESGAVALIDGRPVRLAYLSAVLGLPAAAVEAGQRQVAVLRSGDQRVAFMVDRLIDERRTVVKDLGLDPARAGLSTGGVVLESGGVAVVLNPALLVERSRTASGVTAPAAAEKAPGAATVLVVDDSLTTRALEKSILEAHGYKVRVAVDGAEALESLRWQRADLVIADLMMPRMDGFQLLEEMKKDQRLARIPVIIVSSLERREEQERGLALGADAYIVKRKFDQRELLETVRQIL
jgi:two-component system chemotaxis sensor kinase CheA